MSLEPELSGKVIATVLAISSCGPTNTNIFVNSIMSKEVFPHLCLYLFSVPKLIKWGLVLR
jgi:hypothetical protein